VEVLKLGGHLAFRFGSEGFGKSVAPQLDALTVAAVSEHTRYVWRLESTEANGPEIRQLSYGETPHGMRQTVAPQSLKVGQLYRIGLTAVDGIGYQYFVIADSEIPGGNLTVLQ
jgi:hypothetical protein